MQGKIEKSPQLQGQIVTTTAIYPCVINWIKTTAIDSQLWLSNLGKAQMGGMARVYIHILDSPR